MKSNKLGYSIAGIVSFALLNAGCSTDTPAPTASESSAVNATSFTQIHGKCASSFAAGPNNSVLITECPTTANLGPNLPVSYYHNGAWQSPVGDHAAGVSVAMSPAGTGWVITDPAQQNFADNVYRLDIVNDTHTRIYGACAASIAIDRNEQPFISSCQAVDSGVYPIKYYNGLSWNQDPSVPPGAVVQVASSPDGAQWALTNPNTTAGSNNIFQKPMPGPDGGSWSVVGPGCASSIGAGGGAVWITGCDGFAGGEFTQSNHTLYELSGTSWQPANTGGRGWDVSLSPDTGLPWVLSVPAPSNGYENVYEGACMPLACGSSIFTCWLEMPDGCGGTKDCTAGCCEASGDTFCRTGETTYTCLPKTSHCQPWTP